MFALSLLLSMIYFHWLLGKKKTDPLCQQGTSPGRIWEAASLRWTLDRIAAAGSVLEKGWGRMDQSPQKHSMASSLVSNMSRCSLLNFSIWA